MKKMLCLLIAVLLMASITACHKTQPSDASPAYTAEDLSTDIPADTGADTSSPTAPIGRLDGERFEVVILLEGMEETVQYEHVRNEMLGFEMDYEYESFVRQTDSVCDRFTSIYDDPDDPQNYLEVSYSAEDADTVAASVRASLSDDYEIIQESYTLERAGNCIRIDASEAKGGGWMPDQLQTVYIIPAADGCRIAAAHYAVEGAEGFGSRFSYMLNTLEIIGRNPDLAESADYNAQPAADTSQWTGRDFGELPPEDFEGWGDDGQNSTDNREWTGADFGEQPDYEYEWTGADFGEQPDYEYEWTGADFGEQPDYEYEWTGEDFGEQPDYEYEWTGEDFGEQPDYKYE